MHTSHKSIRVLGDRLVNPQRRILNPLPNYTYVPDPVLALSINVNVKYTMPEGLFSQNKTISFLYINIEEDNTYIRPLLKTERKPHNKGRTRRKPRGNPVAGWGSQESRGAHNPETGALGRRLCGTSVVQIHPPLPILLSKWL